MSNNPNVASMLLTDFSEGGGLADDFSGTITEVRVVGWDYDKPGEVEPVLAVRVTIESEDHEQPVIQHYSAGKLVDFQPSMDGEESALDEDGKGEGIYALKVGKATKLNGGSNWALFLRSMVDAGVPMEMFQPNVDSLEGVKGHFNRLPQPKRSGLKNSNESGRERMYLAMTAFEGVEKATGKGAGEGASKPATATGKGAAAGKPKAQAVSQAVIDIIVETVVNAGELPKAKLAQAFIKGLEGAERTAAVKLIQDNEFLGSLGDHGIEFNSGTGMLSVAG